VSGAPARCLQEVRTRRKGLVRRLLRWAQSNQRRYPWREPGCSPYEILIAEILLKRTTSTAASRVYEDFLRKHPSFSAIAEAPAPCIEESLRSIGLHKQRAQGVKEMAAYVQERYGGTLPQDVRSLGQIPHAGPYIARAVVSFAYNRPAAVVDSNVARILRRVFAESMPEHVTRSLLQSMADALVPRRKHRAFNFALLDLGATVCRYGRPRCGVCPLRPVCDHARTRILPEAAVRD